MDPSNFFNATMKELMKSCGIDAKNLDLSYKKFILDIVSILVGSRICHLVLRRFHQPRIVADFVTGMILANFNQIKIEEQVLQAFQYLEVIASATYMFVLGLEMEPHSIIKIPGQEASIAYSGIITTILFTVIAFLPFMHFNFRNMISQKPHILAIFCIMFATTSSPIVTRLTTDLKLGKTDIGRCAVRASLANDMLCTLLVSFLFAFRGKDGDATAVEIMLVFAGVSIEMVLIFVLLRPVYKYVNEKNADGRPLNGIHMAGIITLTQILCYSGLLFNYDVKANSFLIGLALPRDGRVSDYLISKINYCLTACILPLYFSMADLDLSGEQNGPEKQQRSTISWPIFIPVMLVVTIGKLSGTLAAGWYYGLHWLEALTLGVFLNIKGYFHIFFAFHSKNQNLTDADSVMAILLGVMLSIVMTPFIVSFLVKHVKVKGGTPQLMGLQWHDPTTELRIMVGLHDPQNVPATMNLIEMLRGSQTTRISILIVDMIELTKHAEASLVYKQGSDEVVVADQKVVELRENIGAALDAYKIENPNEQNLVLKRILAISEFDEMHIEICFGAQDALVVMIILPFHKRQRVDGSMDDGKLGFRTVNRNVLQRATCSVGILVDRGLGRINRNTAISNSSLNVAVIFTGGADDREALAYAGCIANHPSIRLMVIRFLPDKEAMKIVAGPGRRILTSITDDEREMKVDDDYFAKFYGEYIETKRVGYMEKHVTSGAEAVDVLRNLEAGYQLFVVGRGREQDSVLTAGMMEWADCPELGPIGDILAGSDFSSTASVLVVHQYDPDKDSDLLGDKYMHM